MFFFVRFNRVQYIVVRYIDCFYFEMDHKQKTVPEDVIKKKKLEIVWLFFSYYRVVAVL